MLKTLRALFRKFRDRPYINKNKQFSRNALVSYIVRPLRSGEIDFSHTNNQEVLKIVEVLKELSFNVDVIHYEYSGNIDYDKYDLIFGFGDPLCKAFHSPTFRGRTIYYGTGMHICSQNSNALKRVKDFYSKTGLYLPESGRIVEKAWSEQTSLVDAIILIGNELCAKSYSDHAAIEIYHQPVSFYPTFTEDESLSQNKNKEFNHTKTSYLWFNSSGMIHKGLDLVLDYFKSHPELELHICGPIQSESRFKEFYKEELFSTANIKCHNFVNIHSPEYLKIIQQCTFIISPSCAEGEPSALVNNIANGLIPIVSLEGGFQKSWKGLIIEELNDKGIENVISKSQQLSTNELFEFSSQNIQYIYKNNSLDNFKNKLKINLAKVLKGM